jgi:hypothetical protein
VNPALRLTLPLCSGEFKRSSLCTSRCLQGFPYGQACNVSAASRIKVALSDYS